MNTRKLGMAALPAFATAVLATAALAAPAALPALATVAPAAGAAAQAAGPPAHSPDPYDVVLHAADVMVPMRDGVRLAADVYRPARGGVPVEAPLPVLLQRTPYGKEGRGLVERAAYFVRRLGVNRSAYYGRTADVPMLHVAGWYDPYVGSMFENFVGLARAKASPIHLLVGPWTHGANTRSYDPEHPVPTIGGSFSGVLKRGAYDQREREFRRLGGGSENGFYGSRPPYLPLKTRPDVVVFQTAPLESPVEVVGPIRVTLHASSTAVDTDFTVKLVDVYPPSEDFPTGFEMNLTDGILRVRYRNDPSRPELMTPGEVYELTIEPYPTANRFKAGHRIRIDVSSSNFPRFDVNPNTGEPPGRHRRAVPADNAIHHEPAYPSHVVLPVVTVAPD